MTNRKKPSAASLLTRQINSTNRKQQTIEGGLAQAVAHRLEERNIANVPGLPDDQPEPEWYDLAIESHRRHEGFIAERDAKHQAEQRAAQSAPDVIRSALAGATTKHSSTMPLNGSRVLRAALAGGGGTVNSTRP